MQVKKLEDKLQAARVRSLSQSQPCPISAWLPGCLAAYLFRSIIIPIY